MTVLRHWRSLVAWSIGTISLLLLGWNCPVYAATGVYCPGCGSVRAFESLASGDVLGALHNNAITVLLLPFVALGTLLPSSKIGKLFARHPLAVGVTAAAVTAVFTVWRNTLAPWLAPVG